MNKKIIISITAIIGLLLATLIIYLGATHNVTYDKALKNLSKTEKITVKELLTVEQLISSKAYTREITSKKKINEITSFILAGKERKDECWHNLPSPKYEVNFLDKNDNLLASFSIIEETETHIHLRGDGFNYSIKLNVKKLIELIS